jgi:hypothetical protein
MKCLFILIDKTTMGAWWKAICVSIILIALPVKITAEEVKQKGRASDNENIEILNYETYNCPDHITPKDSLCIRMLYKARKQIDRAVSDYGRYTHKIISDCFDDKGSQIEGGSSTINDYQALSPGEVRKLAATCPPKTAKFNLRVYSPK